MERSKGFTLIELMIVVGIIGILASVAIPAFMEYVVQAKRAEAPILMSSLADSEVAFYQKPRVDANGHELNPCYLPASWSPDATPTNLKRGWHDNSAAGVVPLPGNYNFLGFEAGTPVYFSYGVGLTYIGAGGGPGTNALNLWYQALGVCASPTASIGVVSGAHSELTDVVAAGAGDGGNLIGFMRPLGVSADGSPQVNGMIDLGSGFQSLVVGVSP